MQNRNDEQEGFMHNYIFKWIFIIRFIHNVLPLTATDIHRNLPFLNCLKDVILTTCREIKNIRSLNILFSECPRGTYKSISDPGDIRSCIKCPHEHQTSPQGSNSVDMCVCEENYLWQNGR